MDRFRETPAQLSAPASPCVSCEQPSTEARCKNCGAALQAGSFRILRVLHQGVHGRMYLAQDAAGRRVALKEILFALVPDIQQLAAFEREAALLRQLQHPRIPRFIASFQEGKGISTRLYLAQEFIEGAALQARLEKGPLPEAELRELARQVLNILGYLHTLSPPVLHRDIKPANLLRQPDGQIFLVDFGSARDRVLGQKHLSTLVGTFGYMPPEQLGGTADETSDLYALGVTLVHLASGVAPEQMFRGRMELDFESRVKLSPELVALLRRLVAVRPEQRFRSAAEALEVLEGKVSAARGRRASPLRRALLVLGALGLGALPVGGFLLGKPDEPPEPELTRRPKATLAINPPPPPMALERLRACPAAVALLGEDISLNCKHRELCRGRFQNGREQDVTWRLPVKGSKAEGFYTVKGRGSRENGWPMTEGLLLVDAEHGPRPRVEVIGCR